MTDLKIKRIFWALVIFTVTDFELWQICLVNISVGMVFYRAFLEVISYMPKNQNNLLRLKTARDSWGTRQRKREHPWARALAAEHAIEAQSLEEYAGGNHLILQVIGSTKDSDNSFSDRVVPCGRKLSRT